MQSPSPELKELVQSLPKAELHIHLEGSVRPSTLLKLAQHNSVDLGTSDEASLRELYRFRDFSHFIELYGLIITALRQPEDFVLITEELGEEAARQNTLYLEVTFSAASHVLRRGIPFDELMDAIAQGAANVHKNHGVEMRFIIDHIRNFPPDECQQVAEWCVRGRDRGVVALGLGGYEPGNPAEPFAEAIRWLQSQGMPFVPHAGEAVGPESIKDVLQFQPPRIGHGFRVAEDPELVAQLRERKIVLELCPTSNLCTVSVTRWEDYPLRTLWDAGVILTLNSDDPPMFNTTISNEYYVASMLFGFTAAELAQVSLNAIGSSLLPAAERQRLEDLFVTEISRLGYTRNKKDAR